MKKIRKPTSDYFGLRALEKIILREMEASEEPTEKRQGSEPPKHPKKSLEPNPEIAAKTTVKEKTGTSEDWAGFESIFTEEEQRFISEVVTWLGPRENKDLILHEIMRGIDEARPSSAAEIQPPVQGTCGAEADVPAGAH